MLFRTPDVLLPRGGVVVGQEHLGMRLSFVQQKLGCRPGTEAIVPSDVTMWSHCMFSVLVKSWLPSC